MIYLKSIKNVATDYDNKPINRFEVDIIGRRNGTDNPVFHIVANAYDASVWVDLVRNYSPSLYDFLIIEPYKQPKIFEGNEIF